MKNENINKGFKFKKNLGQNFLSDTNLLNSLVKLTPLTVNDNVLEIGLGRGSLTAVLVKNAKKVVGYELDIQLKSFLEEKFEDVQNLSLFFDDGLKTNIKTIENHFNGERFSVIANIPYYITSPLIFKFLEETNKVDFIAVMIQKEVAERIVAQKNTSNYGGLSVICQHHANCKIKKIVSKKMFFPVPKVDSAFILLEKNKEFDFEFAEFVRASFAMRRKTLVNNLISHYNFQRVDVVNALEKLGLLETVRAENLSKENFFALLQHFKTISSN
jgi:16S rRNA (adenine1518-N6/adenine1519-N6)-dimethyltransferase